MMCLHAIEIYGKLTQKRSSNVLHSRALVPWMCSISLLTFWCNLMETILLKRFDGNYTLENLYGRFDGNYTLENLYGQFDGNYTFDQIDVNYTLGNLYG